MRTSIFTALFAGFALLPVSVLAADTVETRLQTLEQELNRQSATIQEQRKLIEELKQKVSEQQPETSQKTEAVTPQQDTGGSKLSGLFGGSLMTNPYISVILDAKGYVSNLKNSQLSAKGVPGYSTEGLGLRNGFNVDAAELMIFAPVDPYFNLYTNIPVTSDGATLEEAYFVTTALPEGFQIKGGRFKSNASRLNAQHPHAWDFTDLPLPYRAFLGQEGIGGENGVQLTWMPSLPVYTLLGFEALQGDNPLLFGDNGNQGPHAFTSFARVSFDTSDDSTLYLSPWMMFGKTNSTLIRDGFEMRGNSSLYGLEAVWKWKSGHQKLSLQGEYLYLVQNGNLIDVTATLPDESLKRHQDGAYLQAMYHLDRWGAGVRYDRMEIFSDTFEQGGVQQTFSGKPWRLTGSLEYNPTEFSRIRAQFTHDRSDRNGLVNNEGILQFTFTIGAHGAHTF
ncbi:MAG TPA: hypothetical protein HPP94_16940 [Desulfuromonadales bacterium]|nr:hypothetical protein [Desulfuromonadales bacterium]